MKQILTILFLLSFTFINATIRNVPGTYPTIQAGINAAANSDTVLVQPYTYYETINYNGKLITVGSLFLTSQDTSYISTTTINGNSSGSVVTFENGENAAAVLCGFTITNGSATRGGGVYCEESSPTLHSLIISGNSASNSGGGISCFESCYPRLENVIITENIASNNGGGISCVIACNPSLENVTISGNSTQYYGAGIYCLEDSYPSLENVTISDNFTQGNGGGIYCEFLSSPSLLNTIMWNNSPQEIYRAAGGSITVTYSDIEGGWTGVGNIDSNPLFVDAGGGDFHLQAASPCIDTGDPASPLDPDCTIADMGAYYFNQYNGPTWHISTTGSDLTGTGCELFPFATIQHGIDVATNTDTVLVHPETYVENINYNGKLITVGSLFLTSQDTSYISSTIIDGNSNGSVVTYDNGEDSTAVLCGLTITNGLGGGTSPDYYGGGITCKNLSSPSLQYVTISGNSADYGGGGIYCEDNSSPSLQNVTISGNSAGFRGGGITCKNLSSPSLQYVTITGNSSDYYGGGICCDHYSSPSLENVTIVSNTATYGGGIHCDHYSSPNTQNVTIVSNTATYGGGGIYCEFYSSLYLFKVTISGNSSCYGGGIYSYTNSNPSLQDVTISGNTANTGGGIYCCVNSSPSLDNVTISGNTATYSGGIHCVNSNPVLKNSILWNDSPEEIYIESGSVTATYSDIQGGYAGTGNINANPLFVNPLCNNFNLLYNSPCIDTGDPASPLDPDSTRSDMGAYYFDQSINGNPMINAISDVPNDQGRSVIVTWHRSIWDQAFSAVPIVNYNLWEKYPYELDGGCTITNDINKAIQEQNTYFQREDTTWVNIANVSAMQWEEYSAHAITYLDSIIAGDYLSYFFVSAHTPIPWLYFSSSVASGYSVDNIAPDETDVYIAQNGSNIGLNWDEVEYGTFQGNSYPEINGIWYKIYTGDSPDFVCDEIHLIDTVTNLNYSYPIAGEDKKFFKIVVSDQPEAGRSSKELK